jgi:hypothetical protein
MSEHGTTAMRSFGSADGVPSRSAALSLHTNPNGPSMGERCESGLRDLHIVLRRIETRSNGADESAKLWQRSRFRQLGRLPR